MKNLKTYEGFFDLFKSQPTEDDKIALEYIKRLKKVKGISPYKIIYNRDLDGNDYKLDKWNVDFDDTPIRLWAIISLRPGFDKDFEELLTNKKSVSKYNNKEFYAMKVNCEGATEICKASAKIIKELVELVKSVYENDKEARRIENISININKAADLIEDENDNES